ncbi:hypothetical protein GIB67_015498 [Kingdonia uniflora]|uniref:Uncharacterized protein n=1 Tax=Kingdonia uniflora TaxID=39325 RepID=A0A7J7LA61_9MAGN|nr:hypothetical protein GIB67_015498 [Kingdonia uniflora]
MLEFFSIDHNYREANRSPDYLADMLTKISYEEIMADDFTFDLKRILEEDSTGTVYLRLQKLCLVGCNALQMHALAAVWLYQLIGALDLGFAARSFSFEVDFGFSQSYFPNVLRCSRFTVLSLQDWIPSSESAVSSIDLGSEWMKVAVVNLKAGQSPISVAINEMSKRKSPALVAFQGGNRLIGEEAAGIVARYPDKVFSQVRDMIGKPYKYVKDLVDWLYLPFDLVEDSRGEVGIKVTNGDDAVATIYSAEELVAMVLSYGLSLAESHSKVSIKDAVITVPPYFGQAERKGLILAAQLADINVLSLINEHSGAALQYGIDKDFSNQSRYVIFYDVGSSTTYAALVYFSAYNAKEFGKTVSVNQFQVKDVRWNAKLGGQDMELRLVEYFAKEFNGQAGNGVDVRKFPKAMAKLKKQVKRTKEILSANTMAPISVESLYDDRDFRSTITREKFEELCGDLWEQSLIPVKEILKHSELKVDDIYAVEMIGGATRVPKLQVGVSIFSTNNDYSFA